MSSNKTVSKQEALTERGVNLDKSTRRYLATHPLALNPIEDEPTREYPQWLIKQLMRECSE